ncbi:fatty acid desaturase-domain-containing protein [Crucibulum laeve]|uniref:Fatty acid desaturase-domain-containing protein n=1 Tax=Crucibulum laeve TaxID=68775 RepID=A0A5C3LHX2_9AGAR|nr:fatty acid desaturase-domain-containing protein [Crucibulum laeve]
MKKPFSPPNFTLKEIHDAVPKDLLKKSSTKATMYILRDVILTVLLYYFAYSITPWTETNFGGYIAPGWHTKALKSALWITYWWFQGLVGAGIFCLGHDAGHQTLYSNNLVNNAVGFVLHSYLLIPYFAWRATHHAHHKNTGSMERDENYVPYTRSSFKLPVEKEATRTDYAEIFEETPIYTLFRMFVMQAFGWWIYLMQNTMGSPSYPSGTNHFNPNSLLFRPEQRRSIALSNVGLVVMASIFFYLGADFFLNYYLIPYIVIMFTFLHHSDPTIPHYRKGAWSFLRGAAATVDRPLLGWMGRFFFHNISHDHVAHHFFLRAPFYNGPKITEAIKSVLKEDYNYDSTPSFYALYRSFTQCLFVEDDGDIIFYKNKDGVAARVLAESVAQETEYSDGNVNMSENHAKIA